jgi:hypothetical protein
MVEAVIVINWAIIRSTTTPGERGVTVGKSMSDEGYRGLHVGYNKAAGTHMAAHGCPLSVQLGLKIQTGLQAHRRPPHSHHLQRTLRQHSGNIQYESRDIQGTFNMSPGTFREYSGNIQGTFREHSGNYIRGTTFGEHSGNYTQ